MVGPMYPLKVGQAQAPLMPPLEVPGYQKSMIHQNYAYTCWAAVTVSALATFGMPVRKGPPGDEEVPFADDYWQSHGSNTWNQRVRDFGDVLAFAKIRAAQPSFAGGLTSQEIVAALRDQKLVSFLVQDSTHVVAIYAAQDVRGDLLVCIHDPNYEMSGVDQNVERYYAKSDAFAAESST